MGLQGRGPLSSVEKSSTLGGCRASAGIQFAEQSVTNSGDTAIAEIAQWCGDDPQQGSADPPDTAQQEQYAADGGGMSVEVAVVAEHDGGQRSPQLRLEKLLGGSSLQGCEEKATGFVPLENPVDGVIAEAAHAVVEDEAAVGWVSHRQSSVGKCGMVIENDDGNKIAKLSANGFGEEVGGRRGDGRFVTKAVTGCRQLACISKPARRTGCG